MLGFGKAKKPEVLSHWYTLVEHFNISGLLFYSGIEQELKLRKVPGLKISRVEFSEGGVLSANRVYLRMVRERLVFDICAAPFGTAYFFSMRFAELPQGSRWWRVLPIGLALFLIYLIWSSYRPYGHPTLIEAGLSTVGVLLFLRFILWLIDDQEKDSYYRQDTRLMYLEVVNAVVKQKIAESTSAQGINLLNIRQHSPLMDNLYKTTQVDIEVAPPSQVPTEPVTS
jgi:hypothetical protein